MVLHAITPWRTHSELLGVRNAFYPRRSGQNKHNRDHLKDGRPRAIARVAVWVNRGNCPHLIESTAALTAVALDDAHSKGNMSSSFTIRHAYALAFSRFVTGLLDSCQDKAHKLSMYSIAKSIGLPETFVELRHQITHEELPPLQILRTGTDRALAWIWTFYWSKLPATAPSARLEESCRSLVGDLLTRLQNGQALNSCAIQARLKEFQSEEEMQILAAFDTEPASSTLGRSVVALRELVKIAQDASLGDDAASNPPDANRFVRLGSAKTKSGTTIRPGNEMDSRISTGWLEWDGKWTPKPIGMI